MASAEAPVAVDGSLLEGGGQIVRVATALSAATGREVLVENVRAGRPKPGLAAQHLAGLRLVRDACGGSLCAPDGGDVGVGATAFTLAPGSVKDAADASAAGDRAAATGSSSSSERSAAAFAADVHTAGAISLVAQSFVPVAAFAGRVSRVRRARCLSLCALSLPPLSSSAQFLLCALGSLFLVHVLCLPRCLLACLLQKLPRYAR